MALYAAVARWRLGALVVAAGARMRELGVQKPQRVTAMLAPYLDESFAEACQLD